MTADTLLRRIFGRRAWGIPKVEDQVTIEDPIAFARPWHMVLEFTRVPGMNRMIAYDCTENERNPVVDGKMTITVPP